MTEVEEPAPPVLRIIHGNATPEEVAAVVAVLAAASGDEDAPARRPRSRWSDPAFRLGTARSWSSRPS